MTRTYNCSVGYIFDLEYTDSRIQFVRVSILFTPVL